MSKDKSWLSPHPTRVCCQGSTCYPASLSIWWLSHWYIFIYKTMLGKLPSSHCKLISHCFILHSLSQAISALCTKCQQIWKIKKPSCFLLQSLGNVWERNLKTFMLCLLKGPFWVLLDKYLLCYSLFSIALNYCCSMSTWYAPIMPLHDTPML